MTTPITEVVGRRVWDSRARPTVEVEIHCGDTRGRAIAPAGASMGSGEARERRDGGQRFGGLDVRTAVATVNGTIARTLKGMEVSDQRAIDEALVDLDGTPDLGRLGANAVVATSMACAHAAAAAADRPLWRYLDGEAVELPLPQIQIIGGGAHASGRLDIQDVLVMAPAATSFAEALDWTAEIYAAAGGVLGRPGVADEGGWWPDFATNEEALEVATRAIELAGFVVGRQVALAIDVAASELWHDGRYRLGLETRELDPDEFAEVVLRWCDAFAIASVEDPLAEHDLDTFRAFTALAPDTLQIVGDDVFVTDAERVRHLDGVANAVLVKPNQAGTLSRAADALAEARATGRATIVSARSGETEDVTIVHLAVGWGAGQLKVGSVARGERTAKWNEALRIEEALGDRARFAGWRPLPRRR